MKITPDILAIGSACTASGFPGAAEKAVKPSFFLTGTNKRNYGNVRVAYELSPFARIEVAREKPRSVAGAFSFVRQCSPVTLL